MIRQSATSIDRLFERVSVSSNQALMCNVGARGLYGTGVYDNSATRHFLLRLDQQLSTQMSDEQKPGRMPTLVYDRVLLSTAVVAVYCRILTEYLAQYYDRSSPCRLRRGTTISGYKRSLFLKHHCTRSPCSSSGIGRIRPKTTSYSLSNGSYTNMNDRIRHGELRS